ncbi:hypothetical protein L9F63_004020 [Diploptera punctata]|uniref:DNA topoisomerase n=1 Tax=Diploptera punctata TaxID=6984 RepID=A0AAD8E863_DIPPU|nr:hypothetical protein L9F63_004020 [Diploptera punctata]
MFPIIVQEKYCNISYDVFLLQKFLAEEELTFESMKKILTEPAEKAKEVEEERRLRLNEKFRTANFQELIEFTHRNNDGLQNKLNEIFSKLSSGLSDGVRPPATPTPNSGLAGMKILNVAEKNDVAKNLAGYLSGGSARRRDGYSKYNKIYEFECNVFNQRCQMIMTSVSGHLLGLEFVGTYRNWRGCNPISLFDAPVTKVCPPDYQPIKRTLEKEVRPCGSLIIWTDCDREGENIGFEIIQVCLAVKQNLRVYRAKFSEITAQSVYRAIQTLGEPNRNISNAVDVRQELDLRIGAAFTRFQTLRLQQVFPQHLSESLISYGSCQFPTLGFVVERFNAIRNFIPEQFWKIKVLHTIGDLTVEFRWKRVHLFDQLYCDILFNKCVEEPLARVESVKSKPKSKWRPLPLDTVEMEKLGSRKLKMNAKEMMRIAEKLYTQGLISYPRTETNIFPKELNLNNLVQLQDGANPRQGRKSDEAHPPIHPTKYSNSLQGNEQRVYEFVVRHFLACCSKDAEGLETIVDIDIAGEKFIANGLMIIARNYLDVYPYEKWNAKEIHIYENGQTFQPTKIEMTDGETRPPQLLTEADLIALMEKHGIGTDATHAEHIEKIKSRMYVGLQDGAHFIPGNLGMGLVEGYDNMGFPMSKPNLRAELEADLKRICEGTKDPKVVLDEQLAKYKEVFRIALQQAAKIDQALAQYLEETAQEPTQVQAAELPSDVPVLKCASCGLDMVLRNKRDGSGKYIGCMGFPNCRNAIWLPSVVEEVELSGESCPHCGPNVQKLKFKFRRGSLVPFYPDQYTGCVAGCDSHFLECLDIRLNPTRPPAGNTNIRASNSSVDSGFGSNSSRSSTSSSTRGRGRGGRQHKTNENRHMPAETSLPHMSNISNISETRLDNTNWNPSNNLRNDGRSSHDDAIVCNCNVDAVLLTVRKEGPNTGRQFYKCSKPQGEGCNYFMWADNQGNTSTARQNGGDAGGGRPHTTDNFQQPSWSMQAVDGDEVVCQCNIPAKRLVVKEGPNKGRHFYVCPKAQSEQCRFFKWAEDGDNGGGGDWGGGVVVVVVVEEETDPGVHLLEGEATGLLQTRELQHQVLQSLRRKGNAVYAGKKVTPKQTVQ